MQSWDRRTSQAFIWGRSVFVSPLASMRLTVIRRASNRHHALAHTQPWTRACTHQNARTNTCTHTHQPMGLGPPVYFGCEFGCPAGTWDWWTGRAVGDSRHTHTHSSRDALCQAAMSASYKPAHCYKKRQRRKGRIDCVCVCMCVSVHARERRAMWEWTKIWKRKQKAEEHLLEKLRCLKE